MSDQPDALRLIDTFVSKRDLAWHVSATAELRRLHEENERLHEENERLREALAKAARDCVLIALQHRIAADSIYDQAEAALRQEDKT